MAVFGLFFIYPFAYADLHQLLRLGDPREESKASGPQNYRRALRRPDLPPIGHRTSSSTRSWSCRSRWRSGCRWRSSSMPEDPRPGVLPLGLLLPVARLVRRDHHDRDLHPQRGRPPQPIVGGAPLVVRRSEHGALVDRRPERLDNRRHGDAVLPRGAAVDPDGRLRGGGGRRDRAPGARSGG